MEEIAANRLRDFAYAWDRVTDSAGRLRAFTALIEDCFHKKTIVEGEPLDHEDAMLQKAMRELVPSLGNGKGAAAVAQMYALTIHSAKRKLYRIELWRHSEVEQKDRTG